MGSRDFQLFREVRQRGRSHCSSCSCGPSKFELAQGAVEAALKAVALSLVRGEKNTVGPHHCIAGFGADEFRGADGIETVLRLKVFESGEGMECLVEVDDPERIYKWVDHG